MHKYMGKKTKCDEINSSFLVQVICSIIIVLAVLACKNSDNYIGNKVIEELNSRLDENIDFIELIDLGRNYILKKSDELLPSFFNNN